MKIHLSVAVLVFVTVLSPAYGERIVYLAEQDFAFVSELYLVDTQAPGITTKLNPALSRFATGISSYDISPDGLRVFYGADVAPPGSIGLFVTEIDNPGNSIQLGPLPVNVAGVHGQFSPESRKVAFTVIDDSFLAVGVFVVDLTAPTSPIQLTPDFGPNGYMGHTAFQFTPDGRHIVYTAAELDVHDLYLVSLEAPGVATKLNPPGGSIGDSFEGYFEITPDGQRVVYASVLDNADVRELHVVNFSEPGVATTLNAAFQSAGDIFSFKVAPDSRHVLYVADQEIDNKLEVYLVALDDPGEAVKLNAPVQSNAGLAQFTPDGTHVVYAGDAMRQVDARDLYMVPIEQPGNAVRLNAMVESNVDIHAYIISPDGTRIAYQTDPPGFPREIYISELNSPGTATRLNGALPTGVLDRSMAFSPISEEVAFVAAESVTTSIYELFVARLAEPGISTKLNEELPPDGIVAPYSFRNNFSYVPTSSPLTDLSGTIKTSTGTDICAMVLASGKFMFSCNPRGVFSLTGLPSENEGTVKRQIYADGFFPKVDILTGSSDDAVIMTRSGTCPSYNVPYDPASVPGSAGKRINITGKVLLQNSETPICAMVLSNGQYMFSCDGSGSYALNIPLDTNGQFKLQVYADGFAPTIQTFDEFQAMNDVRMARAVECQ